MYKATSSPTYEDSVQNFEQAILGWSRVNAINTDRLDRFFPLSVPNHVQGSCNAQMLTVASQNRTADPDGTPAGGINPSNFGEVSPNAWWPVSPFNLYDCTFNQLPYSRFMTDAQAYASPSSPKELGRFIKVEEIPTAREFRRVDFGVQLDDANRTEILQVGFVPFIQSEVYYTFFQVPYPDGVPWNAIGNAYLTVNDSNFDAQFLTDFYLSGELLFTRVEKPDDFYFGPGGHKYVDLRYCFTWNIIGWNRVLRANGTYANLIRKNVTPPTPLYLTSDFRKLFTPGA